MTEAFDFFACLKDTKVFLLVTEVVRVAFSIGSSHVSSTVNFADCAPSVPRSARAGLLCHHDMFMFHCIFTLCFSRHMCVSVGYVSRHVFTIC